MHITPVIITHIGRERRKDNKFEGVTVMGGGEGGVEYYHRMQQFT